MASIDIKCRYCKTFYDGPVLSSDKGKVKRYCRTNGKEIFNSDRCCRKFIPAKGYTCDLQNFRTSLEVCINRRRNKKGYEAWRPCKKCRQFALEIQPVVDRYMKRTIKRRDSDSPHGWAMRERVITRRQLKSLATEEVRKITRRKKRGEIDIEGFGDFLKPKTRKIRRR